MEYLQETMVFNPIQQLWQLLAFRVDVRFNPFLE